MEAKFTVPGRPVGKARPRVTRNWKTGRSVTFTPQQTVAYENLVRYSYSEQCRGITFAGPIEAEITGYFPIPKSAGKKQRAAMAEEKTMHTKKPDCDNFAKAVLDSLNDTAYPDDAQIAVLTVRKLYSEDPRTEIVLKEADQT